jgi:bacteriorhodopsin
MRAVRGAERRQYARTEWVGCAFVRVSCAMIPVDMRKRLRQRRALAPSGIRDTGRFDLNTPSATALRWIASYEHDMILRGIAGAAQCFSFFMYQRQAKRRCKFEVLFVTSVGAFCDLLKLTVIDKQEPSAFEMGNSGQMVYWSRWAGWLATCPVLLIHLSNLAGKEVFKEVRRMMKMLISFQIMIVFGATASMIASDMKYIFFLAGCRLDLFPSPRSYLFDGMSRVNCD